MQKATRYKDCLAGISLVNLDGLIISFVVSIDSNGNLVAVLSAEVCNVELVGIVLLDLDSLAVVSNGSATIDRDVYLIAIRIPVLLVQVDVCRAVLGGSLVGKVGLEVCRAGVEMHLFERTLGKGQV